MTQNRRQFLASSWGTFVLSAGAGRVFAQGNDGSVYADTIRGESNLVAYWRLEGDLQDELGGLNGSSNNGLLRFQAGATRGGQSAQLQPGQFIVIPPDDKLDTQHMSLELFFRLSQQAAEGARQCIIARRDTANRFAIHAAGDLSHLSFVGLADVATRIHLPSGPLQLGHWHHLAVTNGELDLRVYFDGVECVLTGGALGQTTHANQQPLSLGAASPQGADAAGCDIDEVAIFGGPLSAADVARHVDAAGADWSRRREQLAQVVRLRQQAQQSARKKEFQRRLQDPSLLAPGSQTEYAGDRLEALAFVLGGIGTGTIQVDGQARRSIWQIFNNFDYVSVPDSFFAVRAVAKDSEPVIRALQTVNEGAFRAMDRLTIRGEHPFVWVALEDAELPVTVKLEAFTPLTPPNAKDSAIPCVIFHLTAVNDSDAPVDVSFLATQANVVGYDGRKPIHDRQADSLGENRNRIRKHGVDLTLLEMTRDAASGQSGDGSHVGDMVLGVLHQETVTGATDWPDSERLHAAWIGDVQLGNQLSQADAGPSPAGRTLSGALASAHVTLASAEQTTATFILAWHFPEGVQGGPQPSWVKQGRMYAHWWSSAVEVARDVAGRLSSLQEQSRRYHDTLYESNLPHWLLDRLSSQVAILRTNTCFWAKDGYFGGWEGCAPTTGCCGGNCSHVWHYAQAHARLFPEIGRRMREQVFAAQDDEGGFPHRQIADFEPAIDGHCGDVLGAYREHLCSESDGWLRQHWPTIKRAVDYAINRWDPAEGGTLSGSQHNTLDGKLGGSTSWMGTLYLAALGAGEQMAQRMGDQAAADRYRKIRDAGCESQNETLFNGEYYIQIRGKELREDYVDGCHIDQVLGEWWADQLGLAHNYPDDRVQSALRALLKYNFFTDFRGVTQRPRQFVAPSDGGMKMITWPRGPMPVPCMKYGDEIMTGFEYSAAAVMVQRGLLKEGFLVAKTVHDRYDGRLRHDLTDMATASWGYSGNPFGDDECGKFYARSLSVWSLLLACQGFQYDGPAGILGFLPRWKPEDHASFFTTAAGWGLFKQQLRSGRQHVTIDLRAGKLTVGQLVLAPPKNATVQSVTIQLAGQPLKPDYQHADGRLTIHLPRQVTVTEGQQIDVVIG